MNINKAVSKIIISSMFLSLTGALLAPARAADFSPFSGSGKSALAEQLAVQGDKVAPVAAPIPPAPAFQPGPAFQDQGKLEHIWPDIVFLRGADYAEFEYTMNQNRDMVRDILWQEFGSVMIPMAAANADMNELAKTLANILLTFDGMHSKHKDDAVQGINVSFENQFRAEIDGLYRAYAISDGSRKMDFIYSGAPVVVDVKAKSPRKTLPMDILKGVDYVLYGSYTMLGGANISVTLTIEKISTGQIRNFEVTAPIKDAMRLLAKKVFDFFQSNEYAGWVNPQPNLQWIPSPATQPQTTATQAKLYCRGQGARFPYARELIMASQGTAYLPGGIPPLKDYAIYMVADKQRWDEQHYFFTGYPGEATGGPVRTSAGYGVINGSYWCVRGPVSRDVSFYEDIYALIRKPETPQPVRTALECILAKLDDFGARQENAGAFPTIEKAAAFLVKEGYTINLPE
ncbi:MAG: hypothetical protein PHV36_14125 [Elusimicrobiales bacterium]|nr:hypothetical protein [Elusimicrobiales bacterium]